MIERVKGGHSLFDAEKPELLAPLTTATNRAYFCPYCGNIWHKLSFNQLEWRILRRGCLKHKLFESEHNGSLLEDWREDILVFPLDRLFYEVQLALGTL